MKYGLIGKTLKHSYSKIIHEMMADYKYELFEVNEDEIEALIRSGDAGGFNVTIPYKRTVMQWCDSLTPSAKKIGSVNTLYFDADGHLVGDNTDYYGFSYMVERAGISFTGKNVLILGSGGTSLTAQSVAADSGTARVTVVSRSGDDNYDNLEKHRGAQIIINTTPVGMYPNNDGSLIDLEMFPGCEGVIDVIYNPLKTNLILQAENRSIPSAGGLSMLVAQAAPAVKRFSGVEVSEEDIENVLARLTKSVENIVLVGMPGCGKSSIGKIIAEKQGRRFIDTDELIVNRAGKSIPEIFTEDGETVFRDLESEVIRDSVKLSGCVIATGGGAVLRESNRRTIRQNSRIYFIERDLSLLEIEGRPLSLKGGLDVMYKERLPIFRGIADYIIDNNGGIEKAVNRIIEE